MRRRRRKRKFTIKFSQIKKVIRWILKRKFLTFCICVFLIFSFFGRCSKSEYSYRSVEELAYLKLLKTLYSGRGRQVDIDSARYAIAQACEFACQAEGNPEWDSPDVRELLLTTAFVETNLYPRFQDKGGDAIGLFQIEYGTYRDLWRRAIPKHHPKLYQAMRLRFGDSQTGEIKFEQLQKNDVVSALFARVKYYESASPISSLDNIDAQADYYKRIYNTAKGKANIEKFKKAREQIEAMSGQK